MCQAIKEMIEDGKALGRSEGIKLGRSEGEELAIEIMKLKLQGLSVQEIAKKSGASQKKVDEILKKIAA